MEILDFDANALDMGEVRQGYGKLMGGSGRKQKIEFLTGAVIDSEASAAGGKYEEGHPRQGDFRAPVYVDRMMISFMDPDPPFNTFQREATKADYAKYPEEWARAQKIASLTPIAHLPTMTPAKREMCVARGLFWVEQIAEKTAEDVCPELSALPLIAKQYLMIASGQKPRVKLVAA
jgi:hypothetical protein